MVKGYPCGGPHESAAPRQGRRILVVDDERPVLAFFCAFLEKEGYEVDLVEDGRAAFRKATAGTENRSPYDLVSMDLRMPNWDGMDGIVSLGLVEPKLPVIVVSGYLTEEIIGELKIAPNVVGWLDKPVDLKKYREMVARAVQRPAGSEV